MLCPCPCPFAIIERLCTITEHNYALLVLSDTTIVKQIRSLHGCKMSLFVTKISADVKLLLDQNIQVVLCADDAPVTLDMVRYGTALLRRRMPVRLLEMRPKTIAQ